MGQGAQWVNKYGFGEVLFRPIFGGDGEFDSIETLEGIKEIRLVQTSCGALGEQYPRLVTDVLYQFYGSGAWISERELFRTRKEALDYAQGQVKCAIDRLSDSLGKIERERDYNERNNRTDQE